MPCTYYTSILRIELHRNRPVKRLKQIPTNKRIVNRKETHLLQISNASVLKVRLTEINLALWRAAEIQLQHLLHVSQEFLDDEALTHHFNAELVGHHLVLEVQFLIDHHAAEWRGDEGAAEVERRQDAPHVGRVVAPDPLLHCQLRLDVLVGGLGRERRVGVEPPYEEFRKNIKFCITRGTLF